MVSVAPAGAAARIAARMPFNVPRAGSGTRARDSSTLFGALEGLVAALLLADFFFIICAMVQEVLPCVDCARGACCSPRYRIFPVGAQHAAPGAASPGSQRRAHPQP